MSEIISKIYTLILNIIKNLNLTLNHLESNKKQNLFLQYSFVQMKHLIYNFHINFKDRKCNNVENEINVTLWINISKMLENEDDNNGNK